MRYGLRRDIAVEAHGADVNVLRRGIPVLRMPGARRAMERTIAVLAGPHDDTDFRADQDVAGIFDTLLSTGCLTEATLPKELAEQHARTVGPPGADVVSADGFSPPPAGEDLPWMLRESGQSAGVRLPEPTVVGGELSEVIRGRRSTRTFAGGGLSTTDLSTLLWWSCGEPAGDGRRAYPSGGALRPVELHVLPVATTGLEPAMHRYRPTTNSLVRRGPRMAADALSGWFVDVDAACAAAVIALTIDLSRGAFARYGGKTYRLALLEAGHMAQNLSLVAGGLGLASVPVCGFDDAALAEAAALRSPDETVLYAVVVGRQ